MSFWSNILDAFRPAPLPKPTPPTPAVAKRLDPWLAAHPEEAPEPTIAVLRPAATPVRTSRDPIFANGDLDGAELLRYMRIG